MKRQTAVIWALMAMLSFCMAAVWDQPSETDAARATSAAARDIEREGAMLFEASR